MSIEVTDELIQKTDRRMAGYPARALPIKTKASLQIFSWLLFEDAVALP